MSRLSPVLGSMIAPAVVSAFIGVVAGVFEQMVVFLGNHIGIGAADFVGIDLGDGEIHVSFIRSRHVNQRILAIDGLKEFLVFDDFLKDLIALFAEVEGHITVEDKVCEGGYHLFEFCAVYLLFKGFGFHLVYQSGEGSHKAAHVFEAKDGVFAQDGVGSVFKFAGFTPFRMVEYRLANLERPSIAGDLGGRCARRAPYIFWQLRNR